MRRPAELESSDSDEDQQDSHRMQMRRLVHEMFQDGFPATGLAPSPTGMAVTAKLDALLGEAAFLMDDEDEDRFAAELASMAQPECPAPGLAECELARAEMLAAQAGGVDEDGRRQLAGEQGAVQPERQAEQKLARLQLERQPGRACKTLGLCLHGC